MHWFKQPAQHVPTKHSSWWRHLEDVFRLCLQNPSSRRLDQDEYIRLSHTSSEDVFKTSSRRLGQDQCIRLGHTSSRRFQNVFKSSSKSVFKASSRRPQDVLKMSLRRFKTSSRRLARTSSRRLAKMSSRHLQGVLKTHSRPLAKISSKRF